MKAEEPNEEPEQRPRDTLSQFGIVDPESRVGRFIAAFHKHVEHRATEELNGANNYVRWADKVLNSIPRRCRKILEDGETTCPVNDPEAKIAWAALNEYLYGYIHRSLDASVALATFHPADRSAYKLWEDLRARYEKAANELERRELVAMLVGLKLTTTSRHKEWQVRDILARLVKAGHDLDDEQLRVMFHWGIPEAQCVEVALERSPALEGGASNEVVERMLERVFAHVPEE